ncbi:hypothetical protein CDD82_7797 [Ophiocordyceps australis]|uniref:Zinc/iron permease n=1 Tax=Ophiocordyceps australis TaxID=1399860 RepID=A0A2C5ZPR0_9HYPO|nr:hypothetical protein CDD82_7797 [Ophiocordyceps australis]
MHPNVTKAVVLFHGALAAATVDLDLLPRQTPTPSATNAAEVPAIIGCHLHGSQLFCMAGDTEYLVQATPTPTTDIPAQFTGCHTHGPDMFCIGPHGQEVQVEPATDETPADQHSHEPDHDHDHQHEHGNSSPSDDSHRHCHFHAGVEHCVGGGQEPEAQQPQCGATKREYNVGLRVGLLFAIMASSALGVFGPILLHRVLPQKLNVAFVILKQFGTGIILSTAFVHLYTHANLMLTHKCLGETGYEAITSAIVMAGLFLSFIVEYIGHRIATAKEQSFALLTAEERSNALLSSEVVSILVMEAGILFHSLLIGLTLVVAGDSFFITLFIVILFHQIFEGIALGTRIATVGTTFPEPSPAICHYEGDGSAHVHAGDKTLGSLPVSEESAPSCSSARGLSSGLSIKKKLTLASLFALVTPLGMAIGIGVLNKFNGNDKSTLLAIGTLDALSAGILIWVGVVEMWAADWMVGGHGHKAEFSDANLTTVCLGAFGLVAGMALMSFLGKWA